ncbi:putative acyl-CoA transferase/carnitine dehydratase [Puniceibacterium sp. IMCC21224]|nr:putative acyl-CoA transferase/carnitine dehydratase [Puniceibacterium sp. IMCC21224]
MLKGVRVLETCDELGEYCGLLLAGMGADVIKIEPPEGEVTRRIGPFYEDRDDLENSLFFWAYNRDKKSVTLDLESSQGRAEYLRLSATADVVLDSKNIGLLKLLSECAGFDAAAKRPVTARITPFGDDGPWKDFKSSDLVHLALGGVMSNCGYDAEPDGRYDLPPIAPQVWHAYHIAGEQLACGIVAALVHRQTGGDAQDVSIAIHEAVSKNTELDLMSWVMRRAPLYRQTARHATETPNRAQNISHTKDGRWCMTWGVSARDKAKLVPFLDSYGMAADLVRPSDDADLSARQIPGTADANEETAHTLDVIQRFVRAFGYDSLPWREAQETGLLWSPVRKPHENALDPHWLARNTFAEIEHPELNASFVYPTSKWMSSATDWQPGRRAPRLDQDRAAVLNDRTTRKEPAKSAAKARPPASEKRMIGKSKHGSDFPLKGFRIFDFSWFLASAGGTRILSAMGAEAIKVEWKAHPDTRLAAMAPVGGRSARERAKAPLQGVTDPDMGGQFNNKNSGKRGLSLNIRDPRGLKIARDLISMSDMVAEGFSPGVLDRMGLGYDELKKLKSDIIYVQQSGMGSQGSYGRFRTVGPIAASFAGTTEMSGLAEPAMPAGWGYSYLDWIGAYGFALASLGAIHHRNRTGEGQWIDSSQCESGIFQTATAILDWSANGREWQRYGNRSPFKKAAPHGAFRCDGDDNWLAIACFTEPEWQGFLKVSGLSLGDDPRFATLEARLLHQDALDALVSQWTQAQERYDAMQRLQAAGVPAGVCQTAGDRCDIDPQLPHLNWLTEVDGTKIGRWPVAEFSPKLTDTPVYSGGPIDRAAPCYGEDNEYILGELLGYSMADIRRFKDEDVI